MKQSLKIKVCGNTQVENLQGVCNLNPDYVGFIFYPKSKRFVSSPKNVRQLNSCKSKRVGVFVNATEEEITQIVEAYELDFIQLHGDESPAFCAKINQIKPVFKAFQIKNKINNSLLNNYMSVCYKFLFDTQSDGYGGSGKHFDWGILKGYNLSKPFILSGGLSPDDATNLLKINHPMLEAIDVNSGFELEPGIKNVNELAAFFNHIRL